MTDAGLVAMALLYHANCMASSSHPFPHSDSQVDALGASTIAQIQSLHYWPFMEFYLLLPKGLLLQGQNSIQLG